MTEESGKQRTHRLSGDSYMVDVYRPIVEPRSRQVITPSGSVNEALMDHVFAGGGLVKMSFSGQSLDTVVEMTFEIDFVLFEDGEFAGSDPDRYGLELQFRKPAAGFIARQIRLAMAEGRDVTPVLSALAEVPCFGGLGRSQGDPLVHWTQHYAREYLTPCPVRSAPSTCVKQSCATWKIAQTCRSSIVVLKVSSTLRTAAERNHRPRPLMPRSFSCHSVTPAFRRLFLTFDGLNSSPGEKFCHPERSAGSQRIISAANPIELSRHV